MRHRWEWPILSRLGDVDDDTWVAAWVAWLVGGFLLATPAMIVDTNRYGDVYLGTYLLVALIVWLAPLLISAAGLLLADARNLLAKHGRDLLPRRVREPVLDDLREQPRPPPPG